MSSLVHGGAARSPARPGGEARRARFIAETVAWINRRLAPPGVRVDADTPLFDGGLIDSIRILKLIAWTEAAIGVRIPDRKIRMDYFHSVRRIADTFLEEAADESLA